MIFKSYFLHKNFDLVRQILLNLIAFARRHLSIMIYIYICNMDDSIQIRNFLSMRCHICKDYEKLSHEICAWVQYLSCVYRCKTHTGVHDNLFSFMKFNFVEILLQFKRQGLEYKYRHCLLIKISRIYNQENKSITIYHKDCYTNVIWIYC